MTTSPTVRMLGFVNHIPPAPDIEESIARALDWGVDVIVAQGTGSDWGPYWLGSGGQVQANVAQNVRPYVQAAIRHQIPFVFSFGIAGADVHLDRCLADFDRLCAAEGWDLDVAVIRSELSRDYLRERIADGAAVRPATADAGLAPELTRRDVDEAERIVALIGPEPVMAALRRGAAGVITGRALDIGLFMAYPMLRGLPTAVAAHAGKLLECGGLALEPGDSGRCIWAQLDSAGLEVRSPHPGYRASVRSLVSHTFYERSHPSLEENPGGCLDVTDATYTETELGVRCTGARWIERPYTVLLEGARREGFRAISMLAVREPALLRQVRGWADAAEQALRSSPRFAEHIAPRPAAGGHPHLRPRRRARAAGAEHRGHRARGLRGAGRGGPRPGAGRGGRLLRLHPPVHRSLPGPQDHGGQRRGPVHARGHPGERRLHVLHLPPAAAGRPGPALRRHPPAIPRSAP